MESSRNLIAFWAVLVVAFSPAVRSADEPSPRPTPRPGTLAALAGNTELTRLPGDDRAHPIVITDDNLAALSRGAVITILTTTVAELEPFQATETVDPKTRAAWRKRVLAQRRVIVGLEARRSAIGDEIDRLERGRLNARALDRIERAEARLRLVDAEITREQHELSKLVRAARREGAQPGWFR